MSTNRNYERKLQSGDGIAKINTQLPTGITILSIFKSYSQVLEARGEAALSLAAIFEGDQKDLKTLKLKATNTALGNLKAALSHFFSGLEGYKGTIMRNLREVRGVHLIIPRNDSTAKDFGDKPLRKVKEPV